MTGSVTGAASVLRVPTLNDSRADYGQMAWLWRQAQVLSAIEVTLDFRNCRFLRPAAVVFLAGLVRVLTANGCHVRLDVQSMQGAVRANLEQNGFASAMGASVGPWRGNSIPFREDRTQNSDAILHALRTDWLGRGWIRIDDNLADKIVGTVWEIYANAFEHAGSPIGVFTCGQHFPRENELVLAVADFGVGIPTRVGSAVLHGADPRQCMEWAFARGNTTHADPLLARGLGLDLLREFVEANRGSLEIYSHDGYARVDASGPSFQTLRAGLGCTIVQLKLVCDHRRYALERQTSGQVAIF